MLHFRATLALILAGALCTAPSFASSVHRGPTAGKAHKAHSARSAGKGKGAPGSKRQRGQQAIEPERVMEIQKALIREKYLDGEATGKWDSTTVAAMQKFQAEQGWQTKLMPDPRALKKLGLGADYSNALNAKDSGFSVSSAPGTTSSDQSASFAEAAHITNR